ncbi:MAG: TetR/AcrR family transcriptional regulator [Bacteroidota bacterium]
MARTKTFDEQEVLEKAMELFWRKGFAATGMQDLVDHMGINRASLYGTFGDKEQLFRKAFEHYQKSNKDNMITFVASQPNVKEGLQRLFDLAIEESVSDKDRKGCFVVNTTTELIPGHDEMLSVLSKNKKGFEQFFLDYLKKGEEEGQFEKGKDLASIASLLFTLYNGLRVVAKIDPNKKKLSSSVKAVLALLD